LGFGYTFNRKSDMRVFLTVAWISAASALCVASAQNYIAPPAAGQTIAAALSVYAFPANGQSSAQQSKDQGACYTWAVSTTGVDPFHASQQAQQQQQLAAQQAQSVQQGEQGAGVTGAAGGAAGGALIGAIAGDAGKGAAIGAAVGFFGRRIRAREREEEAEQQQSWQTQTAQQNFGAQMNSFKKAFSACLEAHKYTVEY
jgi:hypothetical protein